MTSRYEKGGRFWQIGRDGAAVSTVEGRSGRRGVARVRVWPDEAIAADVVHVRTLAHVRHKWWLDEPPDRSAEAARPFAAAENAALEAAALADLGADGPLLVWADWLAAAGDPRGELIALAVARERATPSVDDAYVALLRSAGPRLLGTLAMRGLAWRRGLVVGAELGGGAPDGGSIDERVEELVDAPVAVALGTLTVHRVTPLALAALATAPRRPPLVELTLRSPIALELGATLAALPTLRALTLDLRGARFGAGPPIAARRLDLNGAVDPADLLALLGRAPRLEALTLRRRQDRELWARLARDRSLAPSLRTLAVIDEHARALDESRPELEIEWLAGS